MMQELVGAKDGAGQGQELTLSLTTIKEFGSQIPEATNACSKFLLLADNIISWHPRNQGYRPNGRLSSGWPGLPTLQQLG